MFMRIFPCFLATALWLGASVPLRAETRSPVIVVLGDSLARGNFGAELGERFHAQAVNLGIGGQKADAIAARFGALPVHLRLSEPELHEGANPIAAIWPEIFRTSDTATRSTHATLAGISGTYQRHGEGDPPYHDVNIFTPDPGQTLPVSMAGNVELVLDPPAPPADVLIICAGRNNHLPADQDKVLSAIAAIVEKQRRLGGHFLVLGIPNQAGPDEARGTPAYQAIVDFNALLSRLYGDDYVDIRAAYNAGGNPALPQDQADRDADVPPASLRADHIHYNPAGRHVWAKAVGDAIAAHHWLESYANLPDKGKS